MFKVTLNKVTLSVPFRMEEIAVCNVHNYNGIDKKIDVIIEKNTETAGEAKLEYQYFISMIRSGEFNTSFAEKEVNNKRYTIRQSYVAHIDNDPTNVEFGYVPFIQYESPTPSLRNMEGRFPCLLLKLEWARMGIYEYTHYKVDSNEGLIINKNANDKIYSIDEACKILSIARSSLLNFIKSDKISSITIEGKRKIPHAEIVRILVNGLPSFKHKDVV